MTQIQIIKKKTSPVFKKYQVKQADLFGSFARGENSKKSDVDFIVHLGGQRGLFTLVRLKRDLGKAVGRPVDLLTPRSINPSIKRNINKDKIKIYG